MQETFFSDKNKQCTFLERRPNFRGVLKQRFHCVQHIITSSKFSVSERMILVVSSFWNVSMVMVARQPQQCTKN